MKTWRHWFTCFCLFCSVVNAAEPTCYEWKWFTNTGQESGWDFSSQEEAYDAMQAYCASSHVWGGIDKWCNGNSSEILTSCSGPTITGGAGTTNGTANMVCALYGSGAYNYGFSWSLSSQETECPDDPCEELSGQNRIISISSGDDGCIDGCAISAPTDTLVISANGWSGNLSQATYTGVACDAEPPVTAANCVMSSFGKVCATAQEGKNCGVYNGENICLESVPSGCKSTASGGVACKVEGEGAVEEDLLPDNGGSPAAPADPDMVVSKDGQTVNYYSNSTVSNSTTTTPTGDGDPLDTTGEVGEEGEDGEGSTGGDGELPAEFAELDSFGDLTEGFMGRVADSDLIASVTDLGENVPAGSCPDWSFEIFDTELSLSAPMCTIWETISGALSAIMLIAWALLAARILLSA